MFGGYSNLALAVTLSTYAPSLLARFFLTGLRLNIRYIIVASWGQCQLLWRARKRDKQLSGYSSPTLALTLSVYVSSLLARIF